MLIGLPLYGGRLGLLPVSLSGSLMPHAGLGWQLAACVIAGLAGTVMTCVWLGWYFAVALAFNGHNDQAGGAARIERFKEFIRFRLRENELTGFVIAVDDPKAEGRNLNPVLADVFHIRLQQ